MTAVLDEEKETTDELEDKFVVVPLRVCLGTDVLNEEKETEAELKDKFVVVCEQMGRLPVETLLKYRKLRTDLLSVRFGMSVFGDMCADFA